MPIPRTYPFTFLSFNFIVKLFWLSCTIFGNRANLNSLEASPQSIQNHKKITKKKKVCSPSVSHHHQKVVSPKPTTPSLSKHQPAPPFLSISNNQQHHKPQSAASPSLLLVPDPVNSRSNPQIFSHRNQIFKPISQLKVV